MGKINAEINGEDQSLESQSLIVDRLIVIPLSFLRKLDSLKYTSSIALFSIAYLVVLVVYHYASGDTVDSKGEVHWLKWQGPIPTLASFPVMVFAYTCHQNVRFKCLHREMVLRKLTL